ncbi:hypothetical protein [Streptomyces chartreusis]|uniref:hypothetical protein n=1 Tax=Streptomyces chartreusis TaxID=1969 RepID=UPI002E18CC79
MSDSIIVRVTLDSYDVVHPSEQQTQVYVQIPEVARASWLLDADFYAALKNEPWPHVIDSAHEEYQLRGVVSDSTSAAARKAIVDWLLLSEGADYDARYDAVHAAWEADQARQHPVARKLLKENEQLRARVAELEAERHTTNEALSDAAEKLRANRDRIVELEAAPVTVYRAEHPDSGITLGHYGTEAAARDHCETTERHSWPAGTALVFDWIRDALPEDDENGIAELVVTAGQNEESTTGYIVTALELDSKYDAEADE